MTDESRDQRLLLALVGESRAPIELPRQGVMTLGSSRDKADVFLDGQGVADVHCAIGRLKGGGWALKDLGSAYGTFVNGERVQSRRLEAGDQLLLGSRRLKILDGAEQLQELAPPPQAPAAVKAPDGPVSRLPQVKGYRVERPLGRGGMGEVYLAVQESLGRPVALKVLAEKLAADADFVRRFQSEARAAAALNHPNVVTVHDVWEESGRHFLAMEYMDRGNLESRVARDGRLPQKEVIDILHDAAKALVYAELRGIVHRDIKPANLMQNSVGTTKLADLGLATHLEAEATEADNKKIYGTPHFISPEQARGEKVDIKSDMYSLGATIYRLASGRTPFEGATTRDILRGHFLDQPKSLSELVPDLRPDLAALVHRLLAKKPDERYPSAGVLLQEIERIRSASIHGAPAGAVPERSKVGPVVIVAVVALALVLGYFVLGRGDRGPPPPAPPPVVRGGTDVTNANSGPPPLAIDPTPVPGNGGAVAPPQDDDTLLKLRETEAENALLKLPGDLTPEERRAELAAIAERYAGTTTATKAAEEAEALGQELDRVAAASLARERASSNWFERLRFAGLQNEHPKPVGEALRAMLAESVPPEFADDASFAERRRALFEAVIHQALEAGRATLAKADELQGQGRFDELETSLRPLLATLDLPPMPVDLGFERIPELGDLVGLRGVVQKRLDGLTAARERFQREQAASDARTLAAALRGSNGLEGALRRLDFDALDAQMGALDVGLATDDAKSFGRRLRSGLAEARTALSTLAAEFERGGWKRKTFNDPRTKGRSMRDAVGANSEGLLAKTEGGTELVRWSDFGGKPAELHQLLYQRLARDYSAEELRGIEVLMRLTAVVQTVAETAEMFAPDTTSVLSDDELRSIFEGLETARTWSEAAGDTSEIEREIAAAHILTESLRAMSDGGWSRTVAGLERLLSEFHDTLLVRLLSDGRALASARGQ